MSAPDPAAVPACPWRAPLADPGDGTLLAPARAGVHLGTGRDGRPVPLPAPGPAGSRVAVLGEPLFARLLALRLLAVGAQVTADTREPERWLRIHRAVGGRLLFAGDRTAWPPARPAPPGVGSGPQVLIGDRGRPPAAGGAVPGDWCTVVHVTDAGPPPAGFRGPLHALLALGAGHADAVGGLLGAHAAEQTAGLAPAEIVLFRAAGAEFLHVDIGPVENELLAP
ncbi:hypothetical protein [Streptomyces sp. MAR4 CNX-425]|uniref:hypothetical protein n=1 Tax=Streptomyces sp. MAR4 CNX-425 TaxID=3406343 RepID=UPI003B50BF28